MDVCIIVEEKTLELSKGSDTLLTNLMYFLWPWGPTGSFRIVSHASPGHTKIKKDIQRV